MAPSEEMPIFVISIAAELAGMHPQTLRQYDRLGLVVPGRAPGRGRRYSLRDVATLREIQRLSQDEGISLAGIARILELEGHVVTLQARVAELAAELDRVRPAGGRGARIFSVTPAGDILAGRLGERPRHPGSQALVLWRPRH